MKRILIYIVLSLLLVSCSDGIKDEAVGMFLLPGVNYGDDVEELIDKGVKLEFSFEMNDYDVYDYKEIVYDFYFNEKRADWAHLNVRKKKVIGVDCIGSNTYELIVADTVPPVVKMAMALENEISNNCGSPSVTKEYDKLNQALGNKLIWRKDGLEYSLFIGLHDSNSFMVVDYDVNEIKK